ncbi:TetR/AcrR family transcriptional regulator [Phenylobacterium immobile]|uniref:TetR/AcrR family transcriptional regulator n=1 Tax=Phenylobacterium immobile TaxID=21 RepID=UPI000ABEBAA0|nr:TetR/AcrR family transcriptional regulator [Phenylobacterium immobile]
MSETPSSAAGAKADARRRQILEAARICVLQAGFHGSSMHQIAHAADLSVGQIYRYFDNKEAIIAALAAQDIADKRERFAALDASETPLIRSLLSQCAVAVERNTQADRASLFLEVVAEAARNPKVHAIVRAADADELALHRSMLRLVCPPGVSNAEIETRAEVLAALFDGLAMRAVIRPMDEPDRPDREALLQTLRPLVEGLLGGPSLITATC